MTKKSSSIPVNDPDQLVVAPVSDEKHYLGNATVVHTFIGHFADEVMAAYSGYLAGKVTAADSQARIEAAIREYGDAFMGRDERFQIAPWQGERMRGKFLAAIPPMKGNDDPGDAFFRYLALQCVKAAMALADGQHEAAVGAKLKAILDDARSRILGVVV